MFGIHASFLPFKWNRPLIVGRDKPVDGFPELVHGFKAPLRQSPPLQDAEEYLHLIQPGGIGGRVVEMDEGVPLQPPVVFFRVGAEIVEHDMEFDSRMPRDDLVHEIQKLAPALPGLVARLYKTRRHVERREQRAAAVPPVAVAEAKKGFPVGEAEPPLLSFYRLERVTLHPDRLELEVKSGGVTAFKEQIDNENEN